MTQKHLDNKAHAQLTLLSLLSHLNLVAATLHGATVVLNKLASRPSSSDLKRDHEKSTKFDINHDIKLGLKLLQIQFGDFFFFSL